MEQPVPEDQRCSQFEYSVLTLPQPNAIGAASGFAVQCVCTRVQWIYASRRWGSSWWLIAFISIVGALEWARVPAATAPYIAGGPLVIDAGLLDYLPEQFLTD